MAFYHQLILNDDASTARLYLGNSNDPIAVTPLRSPLSMSVDINWIQGTDFTTMFKEGVGAAMQAVVETYKNIDQLVTKAVNEVGGWGGHHKFNDANYQKTRGQSQARLIFASDGYAKFGGSESSIGIPELEFIFVDTGKGSDYLSQVAKLLNHTLPYIADSYYSKKVGDKTMYYKTEIPPNDFRNRYDGFSSAGLSNDLTICLGHRTIPHVLPTRVDIEYSMTGCIYNGVWRPHYIKVRVGFRLALKITTNEIKAMLGVPMESASEKSDKKATEVTTKKASKSKK
jgi:hypothetical protein